MSVCANLKAPSAGEVRGSDDIRVADEVRVVETLGRLEAIHEPLCAAVIWRRAPLPDVNDWLAKLPPEQLPRGRTIVAPQDARAAALVFCGEAGTPEGDVRAQFIDDVTALAQGYAQTVAARYLRLRFDVVNTNACRKFHIDAVTSRLVCTYRGTGTQYGVALAHTDPDRVFTVPTASPIILRGTKWPDNVPSGILHRSPPIAGTDETRLLLVLDPLSSLT